MNFWTQMIKGQRARRPLALINVLGLSVCMAAALVILVYVRFELGYDSFHDGDRVYRVESRLYEGSRLTDNWATTAFGHATAMKQEIPGIETSVRLTAQDREQVVEYGDMQFVESRYCYTEPSFFEVFRFPVVRGDRAGQLARPNTAVITESAAHRYFGRTEPLGKILTFRTATAEQHFEVTGVIADMPANSHFRYDFLLSYHTIPKERQDIWYIHGVYTYVRLSPGRRPADVETAFRAIAGKYKTAALRHKTWAVELLPLKDIHLAPPKSYEKEAKGSRTAVYILSVMAVALLLTGWVNALNLAVARTLERGKEFGVRKVFGATYGQILLAGLCEAGMLNGLAMVLALGWFEVLLPLAGMWAGQDFGAGVLSHAFFWQLVGGMLLAGIVATGLYPSFRQMRIRPLETMRGKLLHGRKGNAVRKALIVVQFAASFVLVAGTLVVVRQVGYMQRQTDSPLARQMLVVKYPSFTEGMPSRVESFKKQLKLDPHVRQVAVSGAVPGVEVANYFTNRPYGSDLSEIQLIQMFAVDYDYMDTYMPEMACGRRLSDEHGDEVNSVMLNQEAVRMLGYTSDEAALGQQLAMEVLAEPLRIVGVVKDYHQQSVAQPFKPIIFFIRERVPFIGTPYISVRTDDAINPQCVARVERVFNACFPTSLFSYFVLDDFNRDQYKGDRNFGWMFASAALLAVFVACLGLWVVTLFSTLARTREIGVRQVLGAGKVLLFWTLTRELLALTLLAVLIGMPLSLFLMGSWLNTYAFHAGLPWWIYPLAFLMLLCVAFLTVVRQVWHTVRQNPVQTLRNE